MIEHTSSGRDGRAASPEAKRPKPAEIFWLFCRISAVTIGGGYVMVPVIQRSVERKGWLDEGPFYELFATTQGLPGPLALNVACFIGARLRGPAGFAAGALGILLPPFAAIVVVAAVLHRIADFPLARGFLDGAYAVVPGLVAALLFNMIKKKRWSKRRALAAAAGAVALVASGGWAVPAFFAVVALARLAEGRAPGASVGRSRP